MASPFCRDCGKLIEWHPTAAGSRMPIDPDPHPDGVYAFDASMRLTRMGHGARQRMFRSHFDTCTKRNLRKPPAPFKCEFDGCTRPDRHRHCWQCGGMDHLANECTSEGAA
jgi:hypothetical protein